MFFKLSVIWVRKFLDHKAESSCLRALCGIFFHKTDCSIWMCKIFDILHILQERVMYPTSLLHVSIFSCLFYISHSCLKSPSYWMRRNSEQWFPVHFHYSPQYSLDPYPFLYTFVRLHKPVYLSIPYIEAALFLWSAVLLLSEPFTVPLYKLWDGQMDQNLMQYSGCRHKVD